MGSIWDDIHEWFRAEHYRTWIGHGLIVLAIAWAIFTLPDHVAAFLTVVFYILREMVTGGDKWDKLGDVAGPIVAYVIALLLFA